MKKFILTISCFILLIPFLAYGQGDIYAVKTPNVMVIFDTSNSMDQQPNGLGQGPGLAKGVDGNWYNFEGMGNHPGSKLYQAKQALSSIIQSVVQDRVNLGFSTYAQLKSPDHMWGLYSYKYRYHYAYVAPVYKWRKLYYEFYWTQDSWSTTVFTSDSFKDQWGILHTGVKVNDTFTHPKTLYNSPNNNGISPPPNPPGTFVKDLKYKVTSIAYNGEYNWYTFTYVSDPYEVYWEGYYYLDLKTGSQCSDDTVFKCDNTQGSNKNDFPKKFWNGSYWEYTYFFGDPGFSDPKWDCSCIQYSAGQSEHYTAWSGLQWYWSDRGAIADCEATLGTDQPDPDPTVTTTQYTKSTLSAGNCYKWADYYYPSDGTSNKPHTWTYFKVSAGKWPKPAPNSGYYPSKDGLGNFNNTANTFDNHTFFANFPDDKDAGFKSSDRTAIKNLILSYLDLTPVKSTGVANWYNERYWTKLPMHAIYGRTGLTANVTGNTNPSTSPPAQLTPLADSLLWANYYFTDYIDKYKGGDIFSKTKMGEIPCRGNYIILLTDGLESARLKAGVPDYDAAVKEAADLLTINVKTFVVGFGLDIVGNQTLNNIANAGGTQKAYFAADFNQLKSALQTIFQAIANQFYGRSNPVITKSRDRLFRGAFEIKDGDYYGHLMAWDADKQTGVLAPDKAWDSGEVMDTPIKRGSIYTWTDSGLNPTIKLFQDSDPTLYPLVNPLSEDINNDGSTNNLDAIGVIKFTLDSKYNDCVDGIVDKVTLNCHGPGYYKGKRPLDWILGDIYHSTPVVIFEPSFFFTENNYQKFYTDNLNREKMIYVGANDGFLHAFKNADGSEKFAIIPKSLLGKLKNLSATHEFYVDSSPKAYDVYFTSDSKWKTVIVSGLRGGGPYYFAVDVTDPKDPKILWEWPNPVTDPVNTDPVVAHLGDTWGKPDIGRVKVGAETKFVAFVTGGYSTIDNKGNSFHIIDIETGSALKSFTVGGATNKIPSGPTAYDKDQDGLVNYVYFGDTSGTLWKVDVSSTNIADWTLYEFWKDEPSKRLPIFYAPCVAKNDAGEILVYFGTGDELNLTDAGKFYSFYEIRDEGDGTGKQIWTRNLDPGEKVLGSPYVANWVVYFTTWTYTGGGESCGAGEGRLYGLKISKVGAPGASEGLVTLDASGKWTAPQSYISLGAGIPSAPLVTNGMIYIGTSLNANRVIQIPIPGWAIAKTKSWREVF
jgi:hypothetical protein